MSNPPLTALRQSITTLSGPLMRAGRHLLSPFTRGLEHRRRLADIDVKIVVSGTRGKSGTTERLYDVLRAREYDAYAKVTGNHPLSLYDGDENAIDRGERVTLYENVRELRKYADAEALVLENQGITDYTTRMMNEAFGQPDVLVITNIRQDHRDTLGKSRETIARAFARAAPPGTHVVNGEQDPELRSYLERELQEIGATVTHVDVPDCHQHVPGAECVYAIDCVLETIGEPTMSDERRASMLDALAVDWVHALGGRIYNAADVNDVESTEMVRQSLVEDGEQIQPFVYLRRDRRARTASFHEYLEELFQQDALEQARVAGSHTDLFAAKASFPVICHDEQTEAAIDVLNEMLEEDWPVLVMGNTVAEFMRDLDDEIERHATDPAAVCERELESESEREAASDGTARCERERDQQSNAPADAAMTADGREDTQSGHEPEPEQRAPAQ
ncbi:Mur ligase family protein [Natrialba sp. SSL1]|uniref:Mur ligase family protein n=1 Tax=Natrialba sp. SSL1 TaxID=1869245 RepID=UPI0008F904F7|nr:Mur ligase family protein [Natrialba sp. SSL1]OIB57768.1 Mur ligase [Natrialba sp. SSL1]